MAEYYVVRDKNTGLYFRGKGVNRWGKYYNQASIYRIKANAENTIKEVSWRGEQAEIVPIQIIESTADVVPKSEVEKTVAQIAKQEMDSYEAIYKQEVAREIFEEIEKLFLNNHIESFQNFHDEWVYRFKPNTIAEYTKLKKKYTEGEVNARG